MQKEHVYSGAVGWRNEVIQEYKIYRILLSREEEWILFQRFDIHEIHVPAVPAWLSNEEVVFSVAVGKTSMLFSLILFSPRSTSRLAL